MRRNPKIVGTLTRNPSPRVDDVFDECFDEVERQFPDFGTCEFYEDTKAGADNGAGAKRQFAYCKEGHPIAIAFAPKSVDLPRSHLVGLMRHEFGHALEYRYGVKELERRLGVRLPTKIERRADAIAEAVWGEPIVYDEDFVQCVGVCGRHPRPNHLPDEKGKLRPNGGRMSSLRRALRPNAPAATTPISVVKDLTLQFGGPAGIVARFDAPVSLYRAIDGEELALALDAGRFEGGVFATPSERAFGASWATGSAEDVAEWAAGWQERRLGKDLFVIVADGEGYTFYREGAQREGIDFDPDGRSVQDFDMPLSLCNTGLGCSAPVSFDEDVKVLRVSADGSLQPMTRRDVEQYVREHPVPDVNLKNFGFGTEWYGGTILGKAVIVGQDHEDDLFLVRDREDRPFVVGARSKEDAVREAKRMIAAGRMGEVSRLNRVPRGFDAVAVGDRFKSKGFRPFEGEVKQVGASYVMLRGRRPGDDYDDHVRVKAAELMRRWTPIDFELGGR